MGLGSKFCESSEANYFVKERIVPSQDAGIEVVPLGPEPITLIHQIMEQTTDVNRRQVYLVVKFYLASLAHDAGVASLVERWLRRFLETNVIEITSK